MEAKGWLRRYSVFICRRPRLCITLCVALTLVCSLGLFRVQVITNPDRIWVPPNSEANRQKEYFDDNFSPFFRVNQIFFVDDTKSHANMIEKRYLQRVMSVQRAIEQASIISEVDGQPLSLGSLCFRPIDGESCLVESPSQYWLGDPVLLAGDDSPSLTTACQTTDDFLSSRSPCMDQIGTPVMREVVFGDIGVNSKIVSPDPCGDAVPSAGALVLTFLLNNYPDSDFQRLAKQWEKEVFLAIAEESRPLLENDVQAPMKVSYMAQRSVEDSLAVEAGENAWVLGVSYLCMFLYVALILGHPCNVIRSRYSLALTGITIVVSSLAITIGLLSLAGVGTTLIVWEVVPFLTLAIGVDNMVILSREFDRLETAPEFELSTAALDCNSVKRVTYEGATGPTYAWPSSGSLGGRTEENASLNSSETAQSLLEDRMGAAVSKVAPSILGAAVCEVVAFFVGSLTDIPALRQFCLVAATAVAVGFLLQVTWFMAALSLDSRRVRQGRLDIAPWIVRDENGYSKWWPAMPGADPVNRRGLIPLSIPLLQGLAQSAMHRVSSSSLSRRSCTASSTRAAVGSEDAVTSDDEPPRSMHETFRRGVNGRSEFVSHQHVHENMRLRRERSFTSEVGSGIETNPALFARSTPLVELEAQSSVGTNGTKGRRRRRRQGGSQGTFIGSSSSDGHSNGYDRVGKNRNGEEEPRSSMTMNRRWFDDPQEYEGDECLGKQQSLLLKGSSPPSSISDDPAEGSGNRDVHSSRKMHAPLAGPDADRRAVLGGNVVEGYVSLGPSLDRHGSREDLCGGLLLAGPPDDSERGGAAGLFCGGSGSGLSVFREQLYDEGRYKGNLASRLLDRYYFPALFSKGGKVFTLAVAAGLAVLGGFGLAGVTMGLEPQLAAPTDFYLQDYYDAQFSLGEAGPPGYIVLSDLDYYAAFNDSDVMQSFKNLSIGLAQLQRYVQAPIYSWLDTMVGWVHQKDTLAADCPAQIAITDEATFYEMVELFLAIPIESQCCQSYGVCGGQFKTDVVLKAEEDGDGSKRVVASRLRFNLQPLQTQQDYVNSYYYLKLVTNKLADKIPERYKGQRKTNEDIGNLAFTYSLYFVFYEQYVYIQGVALQNIALALAVVFLSIGVLSGFVIAWIVTLLVLCTTLGTVGLVWGWGELSSAAYGVSINAVSVCNLVMSLGLSVEFCLHVAVAFRSVPGTRQERAEAAMKSAGASVLTGITLTKLVGVSVLAIAPSLLFRIYYFRMYMATVVAGAFQGLAVLPVLLSLCGPQAPPNVLPRTVSWADTWADKHDDISSSPLSSPSPEYGVNPTGGPGGAIGWHWSRVDSGGGLDCWGEEELLVKGVVGGDKKVSLGHRSHVTPGDSVVL